MSLNEPTLLYSKEDHKRITSLFAVQIWFLKISGQYPLKLSQWLSAPFEFLGRLLIYIYNIFLIFQHWHISLLHMKRTYDKFYDGRLEDITDALIMVVIYSFAGFATPYFMWYGKTLEQFLKRISRNYRHHSQAGLTFVNSYASYKRAHRLMIFWSYAGLSGALLWSLAPMLMHSRTLPLKCWYPFDELQPVVYELVYVLQLLAQILMGFTFSNSSGLYVSLVMVLLGQFDVLFCSLKNFEFNARLKSGVDLRTLRKLQKDMPLGKDDELNQYIYSTEFKTDLAVFESLLKHKNRTPNKSYKQYLHESLVDCFQHHRFIVDCCREFEQLFSPFCLVKSLQITFQLCLLMFVGVVGQKTPLRIIMLLQYTTLTTVDLLMYTYFGGLLRRHSLRGGEALWRSPWWRDATPVRQDIMIFLINSQLAVKLTAGKFFVMEIERFRSVVMQAFSFLTLLQKLNAKNVK